ncbi:MAG: hypothetical protein V4808_01450 [Pseudomonadota bacterium]
MIKLSLALAILLAADQPAMVVTGDRILGATVHGTPARLRIDPGGPTMPVFNPDFAARAGFEAGWIGTSVRVGPVRVEGRSAVVRFDMEQSEFKRRVTWFRADYLKGADGAVGPGTLAAPVIRFDIHAPQPGERRVTLPLADFGYGGMGYAFEIAGAKVRVRFSLDRERTIATAALGAEIATAYQGKFDRPAETMLVLLGVERPVRHLALGASLQVGPFALNGLHVRTGDFGSVDSIPDPDAPVAEPDPDEIVVTGEKKKKNRMVLDIGRDYLDRCSSIVFDKPAKALTFTCR